MTTLYKRKLLHANAEIARCAIYVAGATFWSWEDISRLIGVLAYLSLRPEHEQDEVLAELQALRDGVRT